MYLMELLRSDYFIEGIQSANDVSVETSAVLLWVWHADRIPPHIGISSNGHYFSLKANGKDEMIPVSKITETIAKKKIKTLCFELSDCIDIENIQTAFEFYSSTVPNKITCLKPINEVLDLQASRKLTDLLTLLYAQNRIVKVIGFNIDSNFAGIRQYEIEDIHSRLKLLKDKFE